MGASAKEIKRLSELRYLLACGVIGPLFFITVFLIEGATWPDYSPLGQPVSSVSYPI